MAARKNRGTSAEGWADEVRERIRSSMLINRLIKHGLGEVDMSQTQVRAIEILLRKALPDLSSTEGTVKHEHRYVARTPDKQATAASWEKAYAPEHTQH